MGRGSAQKQTFLSIHGSNIVERIGSTTDKLKAEGLCPHGAVPREILNKDGSYVKTVFEMLDDFVEGIITNVSLREGEYGWECRIKMQDATEEFILTISANTDYFKHFAKKIANIKNKGAMIKFSPYDFVTKEGSRMRGITISQMGDNAKWYFTKDNNHGLPIFTKAPEGVNYQNWSDEIKDEYGLYMKKRDRWLRNYVSESIAPLFSGNDLPEPSLPDEEEPDLPLQTKQSNQEAGAAKDDLPF